MATPKHWFITGISRGLGRAIAAGVLDRGDVVIGTTRDGTSDLPAGGRLHVLPLEVTDAAQCRDAVARAHAIGGRLDVVLNNAGFGLLGPVEATRADEARDVMSVNFGGTLNVVQAALPLLRAQRGGHVVNVTSIAGLAPSPGAGLYAAAKFAVEGFSASLAQEVAPLGIKVTCVAPGAFRTDFLADTSIRYTADRLGDAYAGTSGKLVDHLKSIAGKQIGDPARAVAALYALVGSASPPLHLVLGSDALKRSRAMIEQFTSELNAWESISRGTDFPS